MELLLAVLLGFVLDLIFGDPHGFPHPICLIGKWISMGERFWRSRVKHTPRGEFWGGVALNLCVLFLCFSVPFVILWLAGLCHPLLRFALETIFCYQILATKSLKTESMRVYTALKAKNLPEARKFVSWIVGRDTQHLDETGVVKAAVETVAENTSDGVIAPLIYMLLGGAPLAFLYKGVNTLDSMVGYKNEKYVYFGRFSAKVDDVFNFIPAILSAGLMIAASFFVGLDGRQALRIYRRDRRNHASPNSAKTESVCAGALRIQLAGDAFYFGKQHHKPTIGDPIRPVEAEDIVRANRLLYGAAVLGMLLFGLLRFWVVIGWQ